MSTLVLIRYRASKPSCFAVFLICHGSRFWKRYVLARSRWELLFEERRDSPNQTFLTTCAVFRIAIWSSPRRKGVILLYQLSDTRVATLLELADELLCRGSTRCLRMHALRATCYFWRGRGLRWS